MATLPPPAFNPPLFSTFPHTAMRTHSRVTCQATHEEFASVHLCSKPRLTRQQFKLIPTVDYLNTPTSPVTEEEYPPQAEPHTVSVKMYPRRILHIQTYIHNANTFVCPCDHDLYYKLKSTK